MIGIRTITYQLPEQFTSLHLKKIANTSRLWDQEFEMIRTQRVSLVPFNHPVSIKTFEDLSEMCDTTSIRWFNVPIRPSVKHDSDIFNFAYNILLEYGRAFINVLGVENCIVDPWILKQTAELTKKISVISQDGKDNFRFGMSVNVDADGPFFPFTYSSGELGFSIGLELTQDINKVCEKAKNKSLVSLRSDILNCIIPQIDKINDIAMKIANEQNLVFKGFDFSIAPIIDPNGSVISILNSLGVYDFGKTGSLFSTGFITNILKHLAQIYKSVGFSGVMYSLLEDLELCSINNERGVTFDQLISLSTMCGCGVDMVPVYGKMTIEEFISIYLDVIGISCRLNSKPLGIRILPIQNCKRGNLSFTCFTADSDFIANTKVVTPNLNLINSLGGILNYLSV